MAPEDEECCMMCGRTAEEAKDPESGYVAWEEVEVLPGVYEDWMYCYYCEIDTFHPQKNDDNNN